MTDVELTPEQIQQLADEIEQAMNSEEVQQLIKQASEVYNNHG